MHACPSCQFTNPEGFRFCGQCGHRLPAPLTPPGPPPGRTGDAADPQKFTAETKVLTRSQILAERRHLSVVFCDLVNSTGLAAELDPEDLRDMVQAYQEVCSRIISRFEGSIAQYLGDGVLAYFGYPVAHEDDARRSIKAALEIVSEIDQLNQELGRTGEGRLAVRIGIHTGLAVVGEVGAGTKREHLAVGQTPNIAARLQTLAAPNGIVISEATERLVRGFFDLEPLGPQKLKGLPGALLLFLVEGGREEGPQSTGRLAPLVARQTSLDQLLRRWQKAEAGSGSVVLLRGEAGIGKSRLVVALRSQLAGQAHAAWDLGSYSYHQDSAFRPIVEALRRRLQRRGSRDAAQLLERLGQEIGNLLLPAAEILPLLGRLLSLPVAAAPIFQLSPQEQRQRTLKALVQWVRHEAAREPLLFVAEDLHWMDPSTIEFLGLLAAEVSQSRILLVLTFRPEFPSPWPRLAHSLDLELKRLNPAQTRELIRGVAGNEELPRETLDALVEKSDGNPLFAEELTRTLLQSLARQGHRDRAGGGEARDGGIAPSLAIPERLQDSLLARLDSLGPAKEIALIGAILGRSFSLPLLEAVAALPADEVKAALAQLVEAELLDPEEGGEEPTFHFRHALLQEAAYQVLLKKQRRQYHWQVVEALESSFAEILEREPALVAHHATEAALPDKAIPYWRTAGENALQRFANQEALRHLGRGLNLALQQPESPERMRKEISLRLLQAPAYMATRGFISSEVEEAYDRVRHLSQALADRTQNRAALRGLLRFYNARGQFQRIRHLAQEMLDQGIQEKDPEWVAEARWNLGAASWHLGQPATALEHLEAALRYFDHSPPTGGSDAISPAVSCRLYCAYSLWFLGFPSRALRRAEENLRWAESSQRPMDLLVATLAMAFIFLFRREPERCSTAAGQAIALAREHRIPHLADMALVIQGRSLADLGQQDEGIRQMTAGIEGWKRSGLGFVYPLLLCQLAEHLADGGQGSRARRLVEEALEAAARTEERYWEGECLRLLAVLQRRGGEEKAAASTLDRALDLTRQQQARSLELRITLSRARLDPSEAGALELLLDQFTEGRETADQQEAEAFLVSLPSSRAS